MPPPQGFWTEVGSIGFAYRQATAPNGLGPRLERVKEADADSDDEDDGAARADDEAARAACASRERVAAGAAPPTLDAATVGASELELALHAHTNAGCPLVVRGLVGSWPCQAWTPRRLAETCGDVRVVVDHGDGPRALVPVRDFVRDHMEGCDSPATDGTTAPPSYVRLWAYERDCPELVREFDANAHVPDAWRCAVRRTFPAKLGLPEGQQPHWLFVGPTGCHSPTHVDPYASHAWFAQIHGTKAFLLAPPEKAATFGSADGFAPLTAEPWRPGAPPSPRPGVSVAVVGPGEALFLPCNWVHEVITLRDSVSLTHNFYCARGARLMRALYARRALRPLAGAGS